MVGEDEDRYIDLLYQAIRDDRGFITGIFIGGYDTTERIRTHVNQEALVRLTDAIKDLTDPDDVAFEASRILGETLRVSRVGYGTIDPIAETLHVARDWNAPGVETLAATFLSALTAPSSIASSAASSSASTTSKDDRTVEASEALKSRSAFSFVNFPVIENGQLVAVFFINHGAIREWTASELALVREFGARTLSGVERGRNERALRELNATLEGRVDTAAIPKDGSRRPAYGWSRARLQQFAYRHDGEP